MTGSGTKKKNKKNSKIWPQDPNSRSFDQLYPDQKIFDELDWACRDFFSTDPFYINLWFKKRALDPDP